MKRSIVHVASWALFTVLLMFIIALGGGTGTAAQAIAAISILLLSAHAVIAIGWSEATVFVIICLSITFAMENIGTLTGFPFGRYTFLVGSGMAHIGAIPIIVGPLYFGMGYASWVIANLLVGDEVERPQSRYALVSVPLISAFVMTQWDVVMDPSGSTLARAWIWHDSGGYFGVPLSNFLGWFLVTWLYFQSFEIFLYSRRKHVNYPAVTRRFWAVPILLYLAAGLCHLVPFFTASEARLVDAGGHAWSATDLLETTVIVMLFTMVPTSLLALLRLAAPQRGGRLVAQQEKR